MGKKEKKQSEEIGKQLETMNVKIKEISENPEKKISPVIGYFPSGFDPLKYSEESNSQSGVSSVKVYKNAKRNPKNPRLEVVVGVGGSAVNFVGTSYSGEARTPQLCNYALGVLEKNTGVLKMVPIAANKIFRLEPKVPGVEQPENESRDAEKEADTYEERSEKFMNATRMYSTKKNIRRDEKRVTLRRTEDVAQEGMEQKLEGIKVNMEALVEAVPSTANARNIPPHNLDANEVEMAYPLDKIILKGEWDYLQDIFDKLHGGSELAQDVYPSFVLNRAHSLQKIKNESSRRRMAGIFSYITHLIRFKDRHSMDGVSSAKFHRLPSILSQKFSTMFASSTDKRLPQDKQDLLISYVLVLSLFADDFRSDPSDIARDLRMNPLTLRTHYESLGCKFVRENMSLVATLPVPLTFQTIKIKRKRQK